MGVQHLGGHDAHVCQRVILTYVEETDDDEQYPVTRSSAVRKRGPRTSSDLRNGMTRKLCTHVSLHIFWEEARRSGLKGIKPSVCTHCQLTRLPVGARKTSCIHLVHEVSFLHVLRMYHGSRQGTIWLGLHDFCCLLFSAMITETQPLSRKNLHHPFLPSVSI